VRECQSGEEAVQVCGNFRPDVVTMDLQMGDMDGMTALRLLRAFHPQAHLIVVTQLTGMRCASACAAPAPISLSSRTS